MGLFEKFGEFDSAAELNKAAEGLKQEGDKKSLLALAKENGIDKDDAEDYFRGELPELCNPLSAAFGKLKAEEAALKLPADTLMRDWIQYISEELLENADLRVAVRKKKKSLSGCIGALLKEAFRNQWTIPKDIVKESKINASKVTFGIPGMGKAKEIITGYYLGA